MAHIVETTRGICLARFDGGEGIGVKTVVTGVLGVDSGCVVGIAPFDHGPNIAFLPIALALVCAVAALIANARFRWLGQPWHHGKDGAP